MLHQQTTINCRGRLVSLERPLVMGILNVTPDSFYDGGRHKGPDRQFAQAEKMLEEGAAFIDVGGMSSRPGAEIISLEEERERVVPVIEGIAKKFPEALISIDTVRSEVAKECADAGACIINDISAGRIDTKMYETVAALGLPYVLMHMQGRPKAMQAAPKYENVTLEVLDFFIKEIGKLRNLGVKDILVDPGFGFGKTIGHNFQLLSQMHVFKMLETPVLAGISRKSMIYKYLETSAEEALNGTTALHMVALQQGAKILRAHDVKEAVECIRLWEKLEKIGF
ncbi:MAG TPA: dihydropteroate synthase [Bacteroidetes bacterium]|nr:dihydropteroate synthase [Bacteroidota bacterium]